jgi:hypothetical protein
MDRQHFDDFSRSLAEGFSRRRLLHGLGMTLLGSLITPRFTRRAYAQSAATPGTTRFPCDISECVRQANLAKKLCLTGCAGQACAYCHAISLAQLQHCQSSGGCYQLSEVCCGGQCVADCPIGGPPLDPITCRCGCPTGEEFCNPDGCIGLSCAGCYPPCPPPKFRNRTTICDCVCPDISCPGDLSQDPDTCECNCPPGESPCPGDHCADLQRDSANCGACGQSCSQGIACIAGVCQCPPISCPLPGQTQNPTTCVCECPSGTTACTSGCVNLQNDNSNCGGCGHRCIPGILGQPGEQCIDGTCVCTGLDQIQCPDGCYQAGGTDPLAVCCACPYPGGLCTYACCDAVRLAQGMTCQCVDGGVRADCVKLP